MVRVISSEKIDDVIESASDADSSMKKALCARSREQSAIAANAPKLLPEQIGPKQVKGIESSELLRRTKRRKV